MKIFIAASWLRLGGGVTRTLFELLKHIDYSKHDVTLFVMDLDRSVLSYVPSEVNVITSGDSFQTDGAVTILKKMLKQGKLLSAVSYMFDLLLFRITGDNYRHQGWITRHMEKQRGTYDVAISYAMMNSIVNKYVIDNVSAKKKIMWCHIDVNIYKDTYVKGLGRLYSQYDKINCVSGFCVDAIKGKYPELSGKLAVAYNFIDTQGITEAAAAVPDVEIPVNKTVLCTVSRISDQKGTDILVETAKKLRDNGFDFVWWVVGTKYDDGFNRKINALIADYGLTDCVVLTGEKNPPYPYVKACDIYVQPSRYEGYCTTTNEAKVLLRPIITTCVSGASEQFENGINGIITDISADALYEAVSALILHPEKREELVSNLKSGFYIQQNNSFEEMIR